MNKLMLLVAGSLAMLISQTVSASATTLLSETFNGVTSGYSGSDPRRFGVPDIAHFHADNNWRAARFERPDNGSPANDVGVQAYGGAGNSTPVGIAEDDGGLLISFDATMYQDITLSFDWRTFSATAGDELVVGYFVGDITAGHPVGFVNGQIDLRPTSQGGPANGAWNWEGGGWVEVFRGGPSNVFSHELLSLTLAAGSAEVWLTFWMDAGEGDFAKIDNILVTGEQRVVPLPPAVWLMGTGLLALGGLRRRS